MAEEIRITEAWAVNWLLQPDAISEGLLRVSRIFRQSLHG